MFSLFNLVSPFRDHDIENAIISAVCLPYVYWLN